MHNVEHLDLSNNQFFGGLSLSLQNVSSLANTVRFLNLSHNNLNGGFFQNDTVGLFRNLQVLDLSDNLIRGELPSFGSLPALRVFRLAQNLFFGAVPEGLLHDSIPLEELDLSANGFTGKYFSISLFSPIFLINLLICLSACIRKGSSSSYSLVSEAL